MLRTMIMIREFDELAIQLRTAGKIYGAVHPYVGQEAVAAGVCANLTVKDRVTSTHRGHGHCIAKGADIRRMMAELFGRVDGYCKGKGGSMHIADFAVGMLGANGIVGGGLPIACGAALAAQLEGQGNVTVCFFGDGAAAEGEFHEALNIAALWKLPIVFVCENNQYAANNAVAVQHPRVDIAAHAAAYDMPGVVADGNDVIEVYTATADAVGPCPPRRRTEPARVQDVPLALPRHEEHAAPGDAPFRRDPRVEGARSDCSFRAARDGPGPALGRRHRRDPGARESRPRGGGRFCRPEPISRPEGLARATCSPSEATRSRHA